MLFFNILLILGTMSSRAKLSLVHHSTLAIVPPSRDESIWLQLQSIRYSLGDKGYFRWPPHVNVVYPFLAPESYDEYLPSLEQEISTLHPFHITLSHFNTFGGSKRGVLWLQPIARNVDSEDGTHSAEIFANLYSHIQNALQKIEIPISSKPFVPHMTVCHCDSQEMALSKMATVSAEYKLVSFEVSELVVLERRGDGGQFHIAWRFPLLGRIPESVSSSRIFERFPHLPELEEDWVREARLNFRARAKGKVKGVHGARRPSSDSPEVIEQKRAARAKKKAEGTQGVASHMSEQHEQSDFLS